MAKMPSKFVCPRIHEMREGDSGWINSFDITVSENLEVFINPDAECQNRSKSDLLKVRSKNWVYLEITKNGAEITIVNSHQWRRSASASGVPVAHVHEDIRR